MKTIKNYRNEERVQAARRRKQIRARQKAFLLCAFCLIMVFSCGYALASDGGEQEHTVKYYTSIEVQEGDTLWDIAGIYSVKGYQSRTEYIDEIRTLNHLSGDNITAGVYLTIPYYDIER